MTTTPFRPPHPHISSVSQLCDTHTLFLADTWAYVLDGLHTPAEGKKRARELFAECAAGTRCGNRP